MTIENARYLTTPEGLQMIVAHIDGVEICIPVDGGNRMYQDIVRLGVDIAPETGLAPSRL